MRYLLLIPALLLSTLAAHAQLKPGFDAREYLELLRVSLRQIDTIPKTETLGAPQHHHMIYRSGIGPLLNRWDLWKNTDGHSVVISIRGTTGEQTSWMENFYAAMVPATGELHLNDSTTFKYHLAADPRAAVHIGWLLGMADLSRTVIPKIDSLYKQGITQFTIMGHSQGGAIAYLLRSYIADLQKQHRLPADLVIKTYCSAPPKPGNTYYAYDYDFLTRGGWGLSVINAADWVPQTPFSIQTLDDFTDPNPFSNAKQYIKKLPFIARLYMTHVYNRLRKPSEKAAHNNEKYLGGMVYQRFIKKAMPQFKEPAYVTGSLYTTAGTPIILLPDEEYRKKFVNDPKNVFTHHMFSPYRYLTEKQYLNKN
ncbi:lipase family protein [Mucilaginibacter daejeonensis]|uniref:lipase family protein n=1 Tax=Mucilaginibacter daejeonensis TaxID=398049 RepID=UPI001D178C4F|nr:lipase family protein [Mucilaginibacter daejeonensis]UEG53727.1 lipase family protein [Mucilaginibacter daejeonensis]